MNILFLILFSIIFIIIFIFISKQEKKTNQLTSFIKSNNNNQFIINKNILSDWNVKFNKNKSIHSLENIISNNSTDKTFLNRNIITNFNHTYTNKINTNSEITNQQKTGRCWIFSFSNMLKFKLIEKYSLLETFELSENYLYFYDKLEKSLYFLQNIYKLRKKNLKSRDVDYLMNDIVSDGGTWNMLVNLINKYGIIPKSNMRETYHSNNSKELNIFLNTLLRTFAYEIRETPNLQLDSFLNAKLKIIYDLLILFLGKPPLKFNWQFYYKGKKAIHTEKKIIYNLTPKLFSKKYLKFKSKDWVVCGNYPIKTLPFYKRYNIEYCNNMSNGKETEIFNIPINNILELSKISIDKKQPIWFGCDFNKYINKDFSILDDNIYIYPDVIHKKTPSMSKEDQLRYGILIQNHAMLILGYNKQGNKIDKWYVENSHGDGTDKLDDSNNQLVDKELLFNGNFSMSTSWFEKYVTQVVIHKNCFDKNILHLYHKSKLVYIKPWSTCLGCSLMK